jgi:hypothetical protein
MPIYEPPPITSPTQFDGLTSDTGLFLPGGTGDAHIQVVVRSVTWSGWSAVTGWQWISFNPETEQEAAILNDSTNSLKAGGPGGFEMLDKNDDNISWGYKFITTGMVGTGELRVNYDFVLTES